jgi:hypothetical protein
MGKNAKHGEQAKETSLRTKAHAKRRSQALNTTWRSKQRVRHPSNYLLKKDILSFSLPIFVFKDGEDVGTPPPAWCQPMIATNAFIGQPIFIPHDVNRGFVIESTSAFNAVEVKRLKGKAN